VTGWAMHAVMMSLGFSDELLGLSEGGSGGPSHCAPACNTDQHGHPTVSPPRSPTQPGQLMRLNSSVSVQSFFIAGWLCGRPVGQPVFSGGHLFLWQTVSSVTGGEREGPA
jgi:hypothetical protein